MCFNLHNNRKHVVLLIVIIIGNLIVPCSGAKKAPQQKFLSSRIPVLIEQPDVNFIAAPDDPDERSNLIERFLPGTKLKKPVALIVILILVIVYSILSMIVLLIFMLIDRERREGKTRRKHKLREKYQAALVDYLDPELDNTTIFNSIMPALNKSFNREVLINEIIDLSINLQEKEAAKLQELFYNLGLNDDSLKKCRSRRWHKRIKGYRECAFMNIEEAKPIVEEGLHSRNDIVRSEAQLAMVRLNAEDPYGFLDNLKRPFSVWEQNIVHEAITYHNLSIPEFMRWLNSENNSVVIFAVKMIHLFKQKNAWNELVALLTHENDRVRLTVIRALGALKVEESQRFLRGVYEDEIPDNQVAILQALAEFKDLTNLVFFKHTIEMEDDVWLQVEAAKGIRALESKGEKELLGLLDREEYRNYQIIIKHVLDKRI